MNARGVDVRLIGNPRLVVDGGELRGRSERSAAVLARLAIDAGSVVSRDLLLHDVWGGQRLKPGSGALRTQIRRLRSALDEAGIGDIVQTAPEGYVLDVERDAVDVHRAQDMLDAALAGDDGTTKTELIQSVWGMLDGDPFLGLEDFPFRLPDRARIDALKETARIELARSAMTSGDPQIAVSVLEPAVRIDPLAAEPVALLIDAHRLAGRPHDALAVTEAHRQALLNVGLIVSEQVRRAGRRR